MRRFVVCLATAFLALVPTAAARCPVQWKLVGTDTFHLHDTLMRSQGVTTDGHSWFFSWQGGVSHTLDDYTVIGANTLPPELLVAPRLAGDGSLHSGDTHIGDID